MTLRSLEIFLTVVERGTMHGAAEKLYISQPSVSGAVAELEREYGVRLFERLGKKLYITQEGKKLAGYARRMLILSRELERQMGAAGEEAPLRVGATVTVGTCLIGRILRRTGEASARVLVGNTPMMERLLLCNDLDAAIVEGQVQSEDLIVTPVIRDELRLICRHDHFLASRALVGLKDLADQPLILRESGSVTRKTLDRLFAAAGVPMKIAWECNNTQAILNAVEDGFGVSLLSPRLLKNETALCAVPVAENTERWFSLAVHKDKFISGRLRNFMERCQTIDRENTMEAE